MLTDDEKTKQGEDGESLRGERLIAATAPAVSPSNARNPVVVFGSYSPAITWRHLRAPAGVAAPRCRI